jgi:hypothetical protein
MNYLIIFVFASLYFLFFLTFYLKSKKIFVFIYIFLVLFHDFIFINLDYISHRELTNLIIKSWQEYLLLFLLANLFIGRKKLGKNVFYTLLAIGILTMVGAAGVLEGASGFDLFVGWRKYFLPLLNTLLLFALNIFDDLTQAYILRTLTLLSILVFSYALHQRARFERVSIPSGIDREKGFYERRDVALKEFWFYEKFGKLHMWRSWPNYMRNDSPRLTSVFVSPIIFSEYLALVALLYISTILDRRSHTRSTVLIAVIFLVVALVAMEMSHTRIGYFQIAIGLAILLFMRMRFRPWIYWFVVLVSIAFLLIVLSVFDIGDASARGRLVQYREMFSLFKPQGYGFHSPVVDLYDSLYISVILLFGVFVLLYFYVHLYWTRLLFNSRLIANSNPQWKGEFMIVVASVCSFIFAFAFQFSIGSAPVALLYLFLFWGVARQLQNKRMFAETGALLNTTQI